MENRRRAGFILLLLLVIATLSLRGLPISQMGASYFSEDDIERGHVGLVERLSRSSQSEPEVGVAVHGTAVDESQTPIPGIEVELIPINLTGDQRWYATKREWTNAVGQFQFNQAEPGEYFVAVLKHAAPDGLHPFPGRYYPNASDESEADRILVTESSRIELQTMHLARLQTVTLRVRVVFEDGTSPSRSNLLFHNLSYPDQAVIGNEAPQINGGQGQFILPKGFQYYARAKVDCDAGRRIESRESRPVQQIDVEDGFSAEQLMFVIPGPPCKL